MRGAEGNGALEAITVENTSTGESERIELDACVMLLGFVSHLGPIADWGLEFENKRQIKVTQAMETNLPGIYAAGDIAGYDGQDHADHDRLLGGRDRGEPRCGTHPRREGPAEVLHRVVTTPRRSVPDTPVRV